MKAVFAYNLLRTLESFPLLELEVGREKHEMSTFYLLFALVADLRSEAAASLVSSSSSNILEGFPYPFKKGVQHIVVKGVTDKLI